MTSFVRSPRNLTCKSNSSSDKASDCPLLFSTVSEHQSGADLNRVLQNRSWVRFFLTSSCCLALSAVAQTTVPEIDLSDDSAAAAKPPPEMGLDLSESSEVSGVLVCPPVVRVVTKKAAFAGVDNGKSVEKLDAVSHGRVVTAFEKELSGKVIGQVTAWSVVNRIATAATLKAPETLAKLAETTNVEWVVTFELNKSQVPTAQLFDAKGAAVGAPEVAVGQNAMSDAAAATLAKQISQRIIEIASVKAAALADAARKAKPIAVVPQIVEQQNDDAELQRLAIARSARKAEPKSLRLMRAEVMVGPGASLRNLNVGGADAARLAELQTQGVFGLGVFAAIAPLQWFDETADKRFSDVQVHVNYRRALVEAKGTQGSIDGRQCQVLEDEVQIRGHARYRFSDAAYATSVGIAGGWSQERSSFSCDFPVVSAVYRGVDVQLSLRQPLYRRWLALEAAVGPRFLRGSETTRPAFSVGGEAWVEVMPYRFLMARVGTRFSRLSAVTDGVTVADTRFFVALEVGAFF